VRDGPSSEVLAGAAHWAPSVSAWRGATSLAEEVPITAGRLTASADQDIPERLTFTVPEWASTTQHPNGFSWVPDGPRHPLSSMGQFVEVGINVWSSVTGGDPGAPPSSVTRLGRFQIQDWDHDDSTGSVQVECVGLLQRVADARFRTPMVPRPTGTLVSEFKRLMVSGVPVEFSAELVDRAVPQAFGWDEDRLGALMEIVEAWPARMRVDQNGTLQVLPPLSSQPTPVLTLTDGERGTLIGAPRAGGRDGVFNVVVARSSATDEPSRAPLQAVAEVVEGDLTPSVYGEVVRYWSSPLATSSGQLAAAARTILADSVRPAKVRVVTCAPDPRVELDDVLGLVRDGSTAQGWVVGYDLPLTVADGAMWITVGVT
jgi:hypothetical protein